MSRIHIVAVGGGIDNELDVVWPVRGRVGHLNLLPVFMVVREGSVEHAEPRWSRQVLSHHADVYFC